MRKHAFVLAFAICLGGLAFLGSAGAAGKPGAAKAAGAKLTINAFPGGVFGDLSGAKKNCLDNRKVTVYEQAGDQRDPGSDRRVGSERTSLDEGSYRYSAQTRDSGRFYAEAAAQKGCASAQSGSVGAMNLGSPQGSDGYALCSPWTAETPAEVCALQPQGVAWGLNYELDAEGTRACELSKAEYQCHGSAYGPYPWGTGSTGHANGVTFGWNPLPDGEKHVYIYTYLQGYGATLIEGRLHDAGKAELYVSKATAEGENNATVEFFTPDLPGQKAGEPGGPLYLNFEGGKKAFGLGADAHIRGFLYVRR
jgi:hypothetical protein